MKQALTPCSKQMDKLETEWSSLVNGVQLQLLPAAYQMQAQATLENLTRTHAAIEDRINSNDASGVHPSVVNNSKKRIDDATKLLTVFWGGLKHFSQ